MNLLSIKTVFRLLFKNKLIFSLCIIGLSVGLAVFITVFMHHKFEYSYDEMHSKGQNIYRMHPIYGHEDGYISQYATSDNAYGPTLKAKIPEVLDFVRMLAYQSERIITYKPENETIIAHREPHVFLADSNFFSFFDYKLKVGLADDVLKKPNTMVISESAAKKYFGDENPIGKKLAASTTDNPYECEITGIFYDIPINSNLQFDFLISFESQKQRWPEVDNSWNFGISYTYLHVVENTDIAWLTNRIQEVFLESSGVVPAGNLSYEMELAHFPEIHLDEPLQWELEDKGNRAETKYLMVLAIVIILVSWLNYMNISTSLASQRNNNTRIKSILGANKAKLIMQFVTEAFFVNLISICLAVCLIFLATPLVSAFFDHGGIGFIFNDRFFVALFLSILFIGTLTSGLVSAVFFLIQNPDFLLNPNAKSTGSRFRQVMVVTQFTTSVMLIVCTILVFKQIQFLRSQETGVDLNKMMVIKAPGGTEAETSGLNKFRQLLSADASITNISAGSDIPGQYMDMGYMIDRTGVNPPVHEITDGGRIDHNYLETLGLELVAGMDFAEGMNTERKILINEEMSSLLKFESPEDAVGKQVYLPEMYQSEQVTILGVLKNYRQQSPAHQYKPAFFYCRENDWLRFNYFVVRYNGTIQNVIPTVQEKWAEAFPESSFDYYFLNDHYERQYRGNIRFGQLFGTLSFLAIIISILGLLGLSINISQQRIKEIGIRRVNGARVREILTMLNKDFAKWILVSTFLGSMIAFWLMQKWLENFAVRTMFSWWIFLVAGVLALGIALLTVSWQSWRAATRNPVEALRYE
ncbi:ABC transporter permease [uncultured Draconibacterium sp.]|uniref:ABC transporter permease n=1 Tax=uncultured Draconibacterium sp. TaxID=1573823 RepID=UPI0029C6B9F8|nr:FtsX-like permease family protein [uncultured Draconibacterium sp.]